MSVPAITFFYNERPETKYFTTIKTSSHCEAISDFSKNNDLHRQQTSVHIKRTLLHHRGVDDVYAK